jgi:glutamine cyclotransferase
VITIVQDHVAQKIAAVTISELDMLVTVRDSVYNELISTEKPLTFKSKEGAIKALIELNQALKESDAKKPEKVTGIIYELVHTRKKDVI